MLHAFSGPCLCRVFQQAWLSWLLRLHLFKQFQLFNEIYAVDSRVDCRGFECHVNFARFREESWKTVLLCWRTTRERIALEELSVLLLLLYQAGVERYSGGPLGKWSEHQNASMDQTPLPFTFADGETYSDKGDRSVWVRGGASGWDKRQATVQLKVFADGVARVRPLLIFRGLGVNDL